MGKNIPQFTVDSSVFNMVGPNLYSGRLAAIWGREALQNSIDAGAGEVTITYRATYRSGDEPRMDFEGGWGEPYYGDSATVELTCEDDGIGMDEDVLVNAFLRVGGSFKMDTDVIGGWGVAKAIILCGQEWEIDTNEIHYDSDLLGRDPIQYVDEPRDGTFIRMRIFDVEGKRWKFEDLRNALALSRLGGVSIRLIRLSRDGDVVSDETIKGIRVGKQIADLGWCTVATNNAKSGTYSGMHIRARGLYQFTRYTSHDTCVLVDIPRLPKAGESDYPLTVSREGLKDEFSKELEGVLQTLIVEPSKARGRDEDEEVLEVYELPPWLRKVQEREDEPEIVDTITALSDRAIGFDDDPTPVLPDVPEWSPDIDVDKPMTSEESSMNFPFLVLRHRKCKHTHPETSKRGLKILGIWYEMVNVVLDIFGSPYTLDDDMQVGFVLRPNTAAMFYKDGPFRAVLINPKGIRISDPVKVLMPRMLYRLVEELIHASGLSRHDEELHSATFGAFDYLMRDHYQELEGAVHDGLDVDIRTRPSFAGGGIEPTTCE